MAEKQYDVCIVGSGAAGAVAAKILAEQGVNVVVLEAGEWFDPAGYRGHLMPWELPHRGLGGGPRGGAGGGGEGLFGAERTGHIVARREEYPYTTEGEPQAPYMEIRKVGGKTLLWAGHAWRLSSKDFKARSMDGLGDDWPISYDEIKPYYDEAGRIMGVCGSVEHIPSLPDGVFLPPVRLRCGEKLIARAAARVDPRFRVIPCRKGINTKDYDGRAACHWCGNCMLGCDTESKWSADLTLKQALRRKNCEVRIGAWVTEVLVNAAGDRATGVRYIDGKTGAENVVQARVVALAAGCLQTTRLLMVSKSAHHPEGLCNGSGMLGKNLMNHIRVMVTGYARDLLGAPIRDEDGAGSHGVIPVFYEEKPNPNFARGYIINVGSGGRGAAPYAPSIPGFGADFKRKVKERYPAGLNLDTHGEMLPTKHTYVELDPTVKDRFGVPGIKIHMRYSENDRAMEKDMLEKLTALLEAANGVVTGRRGLFVGGLHWSGTARMGDDPATAVTNKYCQAHQVKNLFLMDSSTFVSIGAENPTLTICALSAYAAHNILEKSRRREV